MRAASNEGEDSRGKDIDFHHCKIHHFLVQSGGRKQRKRRRKSTFSIHSILLGLFWIAASFENRYGFPFVMRNSWISPAMGFSHSIARTLKRRGSILPFGGNGFCLYNSNLDGFFEKGGDMDRLMEELAENQNQQQPNQFNNNNKTATEWINAQDLLSLVGINERETAPSPVEIKEIRNKRVYVKQDDQLRLSGSGISGNKARKMWTLNEIPAHQFPSCLVSYGGPQSNSMLALAAVANFKNRELLLNNNESIDENMTNSSSLPVRFVYYTKKLPRFLRKQPNGNFFRALSLGMELVEISHEEYARLFEHPDGKPGLEPPCANSLWVPQGGAFPPAREGAEKLAQEIVDYWSETSPDRPLTVCVPGGTCTTALLLHHELQQLLEEDSATMDIRVVVVPCVGDASYARRQMMSLSGQIGASPENIPTILPPQPEYAQSGSKDSYFSFGKPDKAILDTFQELQETSNLLVDLLYGAPSFAILWRHWGDETSSRLSPDLAFDPKQPLEGREIMYVHSGGLEGINSQMLRYKYNGLVEIKDVQLPGRQNRSKPTRRGNKKKQQPQ
mmetsp:Transcript_20040/g.49867  ORF Transcript_20040/g.49867 Transcript_20040/m.49867 type:complete len:561 (-) Transcript_20040:103-1785(-)